MTISLDTLREEYLKIDSIIERYCLSLKSEFEALLKANDIKLAVPISYRIKNWDDISDKIDRRELKLSSIKDLHDLAGLRLILLFKRDIPGICDLLSNKFSIIEKEDTSEKLDNSHFGYHSIHFTIQLPSEWLQIPSFADYKDLKAEIQIRTLAQHYWAVASHILQYKHESSVPYPVRRTINRVSALLETVDLEFERVLQEREDYILQVDSVGTDEILNVDSLTKILDSHLPPQNKKDGDSYSELLQDLKHFGIDTMGKLIELIKNNVKEALEHDAQEVERKKQTRDYFSTSKERIDRGVFYTYVGLVRSMLGIVLGKKWDNYSRSRLTKTTRR